MWYRRSCLVAERSTLGQFDLKVRKFMIGQQTANQNTRKTMDDFSVTIVTEFDALKARYARCISNGPTFAEGLLQCLGEYEFTRTTILDAAVVSRKDGEAEVHRVNLGRTRWQPLPAGQFLEVVVRYRPGLDERVVYPLPIFLGLLPGEMQDIALILRQGVFAILPSVVRRIVLTCVWRDYLVEHYNNITC
eukprot:Lithocolla_globosa_v1_NODE_2633_length_1926_cov_12.451096.p1 type:complete len:191 gc:universal NODE_2633_length_1926_cov_12.451096:282-854(+)